MSEIETSEPLVYLNGAMTPIADAKVSVLDRGFVFGDGVYEVIPIYSRRMFRPAQHMARLFRNLAAISIPNPHNESGWMEIIERVVAAHPAPDQMAYLQVTRGVAKRAHAFPSNATPTVFIMTNPIVLPTAATRAAGVACVSMEDKRWLHCEIKSISLLGNVLAAQHAVQHNAVESIQFRDEWLTEGSTSNVWVVKDGIVVGPPKDNLILEGIRYGLLEELCAANNIALECRRIPRQEVLTADEIILSSATKEVLPVVSLDGQPVGAGIPGPVYQHLYQAYQAAKAAAA